VTGPDESTLHSFRPGGWFGVLGRHATVLLPPSDRARVAALWELVDDGAGFDEVLDALIAGGLRELPGFVLVSEVDGETRVVLRGAARAVFTTDEDTVELEGSSATTWVERSLRDVRRMVVHLSGDAGGPDLVVDGGLVRLGRLDRPARVADATGSGSSAPVGDQGAAPVDDEGVAPVDDAADEADVWPADDRELLVDLPTDEMAALVEPTSFEEPAAEGPVVEDLPVPDDEHSFVDPDGDADEGGDAGLDILFGRHVDPDPPTEALDLMGSWSTGPSPAVPSPGPPPEPPPASGPDVSGPVARLTFSSGETVDVDGPVLVGRAPQSGRSGSPGQPRLVTVPSPHLEISSTHLEVRPGAGEDHGAAVATDLGSTNGTTVVQPGLPPEDLHAGTPVRLFPGAVIDLGDGLTIRVSAP
jgi:FHA domain-containing protein